MKLMAIFASRVVGGRLTDTSSGFRVIREPLLSEFVRQFPVHYLGGTFDVTVHAGRQGYRIGERSTRMQTRAGGSPSNNSWWSMLYLLRSLAVMVIGSPDRLPKSRDEEMG